MITIIIYAAIGAVGVTLLLILFSKMGKREQEANPKYAWEKAVEEYGDPTLIKLYKNATSDAERAEIAAFVQGKPSDDEDSIEYQNDYDEFYDENEQTLQDINEQTTDESQDEESINEKTIFNAPAYDFWNESALEENTNSIDDFNISDNHDANITNEEKIELQSVQENSLCSVCGNPIEPDNKFCLICGTAIESLPEEDEPIQSENAHEPFDEIFEEKKPRRRIFGRRKKSADDTDLGEVGSAIMNTDEISINNSNTITTEKETQNQEEYCSNCGAPIIEGNAFCLECGTPLAKQEIVTSDNTFTDSVNEAPIEEEQDVVSAYHASTANSFAAATARGLISDPENTTTNMSSPFSENEQKTDDSFTSSFTTAHQEDNNAPDQKDTPVDKDAEEESITIDKILMNVRALEERIMTEANTPVNNYSQKDNTQNN